MSGFEGNPLIYAASAMQQTDDSMRTAFTNDAVSTVNLAFILMQLQGGWVDDQGDPIKGWTDILEDDRNQYLMDVLAGGDGASGKAKADQSAYEIDSTRSDQQTSSWQSIIQAAHAQVDQDNNSRESNISLIGSSMSTQGYAENLTKQGIRG